MSYGGLGNRPDSVAGFTNTNQSHDLMSQEDIQPIRESQTDLIKAKYKKT